MSRAGYTTLDVCCPQCMAHLVAGPYGTYCECRQRQWISCTLKEAEHLRKINVVIGDAAPSCSELDGAT